jgi:hypothetical protein
MAMEVVFSAKVHDVNIKVVDVGKDALPTLAVNLVNRGSECITDAQDLLNLLGKRVIVTLVQEQGDLPFDQGGGEAQAEIPAAAGSEEGNPD